MRTLETVYEAITTYKTACQEQWKLFCGLPTRGQLGRALAYTGLGLALGVLLHKPPERVTVVQEPVYIQTEQEIPSGIESHLQDMTFEYGQYIPIVDPEDQSERVYQFGLREVMRHPVSTGRVPGDKQRGGDNRTPENRPGELFEVTMIERSHNWPYQGRLAFGPYFVRIDSPDRRLAPWGITYKGSSIGLHGTDEPHLLGQRASQGCIRHDDSVIRHLVESGMLRVGSPVMIKSGVFDEPGQSD